MSASNDLQKAIYTALTGAGLTVFDYVPDNEDGFPYVTIGEDTLVDWDTKVINGFNTPLMIHTWSRGVGRKECKDIQGTIYSTLHNQTLPMDDHTMFLMRRESSLTKLDPDGVTRHGVCTYRILMSEN